MKNTFFLDSKSILKTFSFHINQLLLKFHKFEISKVEMGGKR